MVVFVNKLKIEFSINNNLKIRMINDIPNVDSFQDDIENLKLNTPIIKDLNILKRMVKELIEKVGKEEINPIPSNQNINQAIVRLRNRFKVQPSKNQMRWIYKQFYSDIPLNKTFGRYLIKNAGRSRSGVLVSTVVLKPSEFSCPKKCSYCPTETDLEGKPTQPKSYLSSEPAMLRAIQYNFDVKGQIWDRINAYISTGNVIFSVDSQKDNIAPLGLNQSNNFESDSSVKMEIILSGGTWESYPLIYRNQVIHEIYHACNSFPDSRESFTLEEEIKINETSKFRVIGLTLETRPDFITKTSIKDYRRWGVTRIQIGVQHYSDNILEGINRECYTKDTIKAIRMLKGCGFKVVCHLMPDLPGSTPVLDKWMFEQAIYNPLLQFDDVKIYPTAVCQSSNESKYLVTSDIQKWYLEGKYTPYAEKDLFKLIEVLKYYKTNIQPWVRIQRLVRDIPKQSIQSGYNRISNLRQVIHDEMKEEGKRCMCIRCNEIGDNDDKKGRLVVRKYSASEGDEFYISYETNKNTFSFWWKYLFFLFTYYLFLLVGINTYFSGDLESYDGVIGFCRLRLDSNPGFGFIPELKGCALIREVHVYGQSLGVGCTSKTSTQHRGYGKNLVKVAEEIAKFNRFKKIAVISGVGTREYYSKKCNYHLEGTYMIKEL
jgi:histone acetyltransferase (RNA polymerase elongator complex component)